MVEALNHGFKLLLILAIPIALVLVGRRCWLWPGFSIFLLFQWMRWAFFYDPWRIEWTRISAVFVLAAEVLAVAEAVLWAYCREPPRHRRAGLLAAGATMILGASLASWGHGMATDWQLYESVRLMTHSGLFLVIAITALYIAIFGSVPMFVWTQMAVVGSIMGIHLLFSLLPVSDREQWFIHQAQFRCSFLMVVLLWARINFCPRRMVRT